MKLIFKFFFRALQHFLFKTIVIKATKPLLVLDIDNTLADTWPSFSKKWKSEVDRHKNLAPLKSVICYIKSKYPVDSYEWVFLTSRSYNLRNATIDWLVNQGLSAGNSNVILVQNPSEKIELIKKVIKHKIIYFDDLSYNHENGEVKFYSELIKQCQEFSNVEYFGYYDIVKLLNNND